MIFYFSGTGNSKYIAEKLGKQFNENIVAISADEMLRQEPYDIAEDERVGFVCPVYWYNLPMIVEAFLQQLTLGHYEKQYIYAVATYGNSSGGMLDQLEKVLRGRGYQLSGKYGIKMVDNYVIAYDIADETKQKQILAEADEKLRQIIPYIKDRTAVEMTVKGPIAFMTPILKPFYTHADHTKKFYVTDACIACGKCERECPCDVIMLKAGKPAWTGNCSFCLKCIHSCPAEAIQYGRGTEKRKRYHCMK